MANVDVKRLYSYLICFVSLLILLWGVVDVISAGIGLTILKPQAPSYEVSPPEGAGFPGGEFKGIEPSIEEYYQRRMILDRAGDSLARILVSGIVFAFFSLKIKGLEKQEI